MKVSINIAQHYANGANLIPNGVDQLIQAIGAQLGAVEDVAYIGQKYDGVVVANIVSCEKHPDADKLSICRIDDGGATLDVERGDDGLVQVVCGAPNVREGILVAWIPPSATVPTTFGTAEPFVLEARKLRGVVSNGMLASPSELGLSDNHDGLLEIDPATAGDIGQPLEGVAAGTPFKKLYGLDDVVLDLENKMFTHRPDCFGVLGVARELAGIQAQAFTSESWYLDTPEFTIPAGDLLPLDVRVTDAQNVPRFMALAMDGLKNGQSPVWLQAALSRMGIRPISTIVDVTNYIMQLTGQPLHAYDYDKLVAQSGATPTLVARAANEAEKLTLLSGKELTLGTEAVVITTDEKPIGLAGIMGGQTTEVDAATTRIVLEVASFDMYNIRRSTMKYGVFSDASTRFSKGQTPLQNDRVLKRAADMLAALCDATIASRVFDIQQDIKTYGQLVVSAQFINDRLGSNLSAQEISEILNRTELSTSVSNETITVTPPFWRTDIELPEDIVEEVGRLYGFGALPVSLPRRSASAGSADAGLTIKAAIRQILASAGANEILTHNFVHGKLFESFGQQQEKALQLSNALSPELQYYRMTLLPNVLQTVHANIKAGYGEFAVFELGKTHNNFHLDEAEGGLPKENTFLAFAYAAEAKVAKTKNGAAYFQAQKYLSYLLEELAIDFKLAPIEGELPDFPVTKPYDPARSAYILDSSGEVLGMIGEVRVSAAKKLKLPEYCAGFELDYIELGKRSRQRRYSPDPKFPQVAQDITLKLSSAVSYAALYSCVSEALLAAQPAQTKAQLLPLDIFRPSDDAKHVSFRLQIASYERTLKNEEVNRLLDTVAEKAAADFGATRL